MIDGSRKNETMDVCLDLIISEVDAFLAARGFLLDAVPPDYTDRPPEDMETVTVNLEIVTDAMKQIENGDRDAEDFMRNITERVYVHLRKLLDEMKFVLAGQWTRCVDGIPFSDSQKERLQMDVDHLLAMEAKDREISESRDKGMRIYRPLEMSAIVPVAGLILARFHMNLCELSTVVELWGTARATQKAGGKEESKVESERKRD